MTRNFLKGSTSKNEACIENQQMNMGPPRNLHKISTRNIEAGVGNKQINMAYPNKTLEG